MKIYLALCLLLVSMSVSATEKTYTHGFLNFPPFFTNEAGKEQLGHWGLGREMMNEVYANAGLNVKWVELPYARLLTAVKQGDYTFHNIGPNLEEFVYYPIPGGTLNISVYHNGSQDQLPQKPEEFEVSGKRIAMVRAWPALGYESLFKSEKTNLTKVDRPRQGIEMLKRGRIDFFITLRDPVEMLPPKVLQGLEHKDLMSITGFYTSVPKKHPNAKEVAERITKSFNDLKAKGIIFEVEEGRHVLKRMYHQRSEVSK